MLYVLAKFLRMFEHFPDSAWYIREYLDESLGLVLFLHERGIGDFTDEDGMYPARVLGEDFCVGLGITLCRVTYGIRSVLVLHSVCLPKDAM